MKNQVNDVTSCYFSIPIFSKLKTVVLVLPAGILWEVCLRSSEFTDPHAVIQDVHVFLSSVEKKLRLIR